MNIDARERERVGSGERRRGWVRSLFFGCLAVIGVIVNFRVGTAATTVGGVIPISTAGCSFAGAARILRRSPNERAL